jgi:hypothetical protein
MREHFMAVWHKELTALNANYVVISGTGDDRYQSAVESGGQRLIGQIKLD